MEEVKLETDVKVTVPGLRDKELPDEKRESAAPIEKQIIHERSMETLAPSGRSAEEILQARASELETTHGISLYGAQPEPANNLDNLSPSKRAAAEMGGMLAPPLEVKFQDLKQFEKIAKKKYANSKYVSISPREDPPNEQIEESQPIQQTAGLMHHGSYASLDSRKGYK